MYKTEINNHQGKIFVHGDLHSFIIKEEKSFIDYELISIILSKDITNNIKVKEFIKEKYIPNYRLMFPSELDKIYIDDFID